MAEAQIIREAQARCRGVATGITPDPMPVGSRQRSDLGIGRRQNNDVPGVLTKIDRFRTVIDRARCCGEKMHQAIIASMAARSMPDLPMTTSSVRGVSVAVQSRSK